MCDEENRPQNVADATAIVDAIQLCPAGTPILHPARVEAGHRRSAGPLLLGHA